MTLISSEISFLKNERQSTYEEYSNVHCNASLAPSKSQTVYPNPGKFIIISETSTCGYKDYVSIQSSIKAVST